MLTLGLGMLPEKKGKCGNFSQDGDPAFPPVWEPHACEEKKIMVYFAFQDLSQKCSLFGWYYGL